MSDTPHTPPEPRVFKGKVEIGIDWDHLQVVLGITETEEVDGKPVEMHRAVPIPLLTFLQTAMMLQVQMLERQGLAVSLQQQEQRRIIRPSDIFPRRH